MHTNHDKLKKVLQWVNEQRDVNPTLSTKDTFHKAQINFDLTPKESEFIERNFITELKDR